MSLKEALKVLGSVFRAPRKSNKDLPSPGFAGEGAPNGAGEGMSFLGDVPVVEKAYEPSGMVSVWGLRLGADSGAEGWYRMWRWWREGQEVTATSFRRFEAMAR